MLRFIAHAFIDNMSSDFDFNNRILIGYFIYILS